jgi:hypothetical protein
MIRQTIMLMLLIAFSTNSFAQEVEFTELKSVKMQNMRAISVNNEVQGYFAFFYVDREDRNNNLYQLRIFDNNLKETHKVDLKKPKTTTLVEGEFNGTNFCFFYYNYKEKSQELEMRDKTGAVTGSYKLDAKKEALVVSTSESAATQSLIPVKDKGFCVVKYDGNTGSQASVIFVDNTGKKVWESKKASPDSKSYDSQSVMYSDEKYLLSLTTTRPKLMSTKGMNTYLKTYDVTDGSLLGEIKLNAGRHALSPNGASFDEKSGNILLYGEYYARNAKGAMDIKKKLGFFLSQYKPNGEVVKEGYASWEKDIKPVIPKDPEDKKSDRRSIIVHNVISLADGKFYAIGEQYKKAVSGGGMALNALSQLGGSAGQNSNIKINLYNMMVFTFDKDLNVENIQNVEKRKTKVFLPAGFGTIQKDKLGYMMKMMGWFDYSFSTVNSARTNFNSVYLNYDRKSEGKNKNVIGNITLNDEKKVEPVRVTFDTRPTNFVALPAKPGYIAVFEYYQKTKSAKLKLEKLDI